MPIRKPINHVILPMEEAKLTLNDKRQGAFVLTDGNEQLAEMVVTIIDQDLIVSHTEVSPKAEGQGLAKKLLDAMVAYARNEKLKVVARCSFVHTQFKRHPEQFNDIWKQL